MRNTNYQRVERKCIVCGATFMGRAFSRYCSKNCAKKNSRKELQPMSENAKLEREYCIEQARRRQELLAMKKRLAERDAAFAAAYPLLASGEVRGTRFSGTFSKRETPMPVDVATHKSVIVESETSKKESARQRKERAKDKGQKTKK